MRKPFEPSPDAQTVTFQLEGAECFCAQIKVVDFIRNMVQVDCVHLDFATNRLQVSYFPPCSEGVLRSTLMSTDYKVRAWVPPTLTLVEGTAQEAIPA